MTRYFHRFLSAVGVIFVLSGAAHADGHSDESADDIQLLVEVTIKDGKEEAFQALMADMITSTQTEDGTLRYEFQRSGDLVHLQDRYADNAAAVAHMQSFGPNFGARFSDVFTSTRLVVYGPANEAVRAIFDPLGAVYFERVGGFRR
ncbi:putative quinol monooxygenase [Primorskyibacter marinus]|uniref:putative quinol monooxygenase n=1 Tax=Primorskyibacter marinus TaxID=1977320 RepID=UPI000E2FFC5C|nr:antibiotic biosynthesis monooxygenase [Primorskyibacter marinus]